MVAAIETPALLRSVRRNTAESDPTIGTFRLATLKPYALARLGRAIPDEDPAKRWSLRKDSKQLSARLGCGVEFVFQLVNRICEIGPENIRGTDLLKKAPGGGKGKMKIKPPLRKPLSEAIFEVCVEHGMVPGHRRTTRAILEAMKKQGIAANGLPNRQTVAFHSRQPAILVARAARIEGEHMVRIIANSDEVKGINQCVQIDGTTFSSDDNEEDLLIALDDLDRELGIVNAVFGIDVATRGIWTYLPVVGAINSFLVGFALRRGLLSKQPLLDRYGLPGRYPWCGKPRRIVHDCGSEFLADHTQRVLVDMDIPFVDCCPVRTPYFRAKGERFNRTAHARFAEFLRSEQGRRYFRKVPGKPKAVGIRFSDLDPAMLAWIVSDYHNALHSGLGGHTPVQRFELLANGERGALKSGYPVPLEDTPELAWDFLWEMPRVVGHTGIHLCKRTYSDRRLAALFVPGERSSKKRIPVRLNPYALGSVKVKIPNENGVVSVVDVPWQRQSEQFLMDENTARAAANPSLWEWNAIYADLRRAGHEDPADAEAEELAEIREASAHSDRQPGAPVTRERKTDRSRRAMRLQLQHELAGGGSDARELDDNAGKPTLSLPPAPVLLPTGDGGAEEY
jgi:transposase InsO family protein